MFSKTSQSPTCSCGSHKPSATQSQPLAAGPHRLLLYRGCSVDGFCRETDSQLSWAYVHSLSTPSLQSLHGSQSKQDQDQLDLLACI